MADQRYADISWEGDSKEVLSGFPVEVKETLGYSLRRIQGGMLPACDCRPMTSVGMRVWELKTQDSATWYRIMYLTKIGNVVYVLHAFEKATPKTSQNDIHTAKSRLKEVQLRLRESRR